MRKKNRHMQRSLYESPCDQKLEEILKTLYEGDKEEFAPLMTMIIEIFSCLLRRGYLTEATLNRVRMYDPEDSRENIIIVSRNNEEVTLLNLDQDCYEHFLLKDLISWLISLLACDPVFREEMQSHYDYGGMMKALNKASSGPEDNTGLIERYDETCQPGEKTVLLTDWRYSLVYREDGLWIRDRSMNERKIGDADHTILNSYETEGVSWISVSEDNKLSFHWYDGEKIRPAYLLKCAVIWDYILTHAYDFEAWTGRSLGDVLWLYKISQTPIPFNAEQMREKIRLVEQKIPDGIVNLSDSYTAILAPILTEEDPERDLAEDLLRACNIGKEDLDLTGTFLQERIKLAEPDQLA